MTCIDDSLSGGCYHYETQHKRRAVAGRPCTLYNTYRFPHKDTVHTVHNTILGGYATQVSYFTSLLYAARLPADPYCPLTDLVSYSPV
jgi:hypothetical protein